MAAGTGPVMLRYSSIYGKTGKLWKEERERVQTLEEFDCPLFG